MLRTVSAIILAIFRLLTSSMAAQAAPDEPSVERRYCTQYGPFILRFDPDKAAGIFAILPNNDLGSIVGVLNGHQLDGEWIEVDSRGQIRISFAEDWMSFDAEYNTAGNPDRWFTDWTGHIAPTAQATTIEIDNVTFYCQ